VPDWEDVSDRRSEFARRDEQSARSAYLSLIAPASDATVNGRRRLWVALVAVGLLAGIVVAVVVARTVGGDGPSLPPDVGVVTRVVDGDTIDIDIGGREERVRMIGIDTPELHTETGGVECMAREARDFTTAQLPLGTEVRLERDVVGRDDYGRLLAYVYRRGDDVFVNEAIVANGFARPLTIAPNEAYRQRFVAAAGAAEAADLGLWQACGG
jgi:endonuclease YncB( thermonuclease family)